MLHTVNDFEGFAIHTAADDIGKVKDFYFDDEKWAVRYLIVETGSWLSSRKVLLSPIAIKQVNHTDKTLSVALSLQQVKNSPDIDTERPVSRQHELEHFNYYGYPSYWDAGGLWGEYPVPTFPGDPTLAAQLRHKTSNASEAEQLKNNDQHLQSCKAVIGYHVHARDGDIGHIEEMLIDEDTWAIRYIVINTSNWWLGHKVIIAPQWIKEIDWSEAKVQVELTRQAIQNAPLYDSTIPLNRQEETNIHLHYGRKGYWEK